MRIPRYVFTIRSRNCIQKKTSKIVSYNPYFWSGWPSEISIIFSISFFRKILGKSEKKLFSYTSRDIVLVSNSWISFQTKSVVLLLSSSKTLDPYLLWNYFVYHGNEQARHAYSALFLMFHENVYLLSIIRSFCYISIKWHIPIILME